MTAQSEYRFALSLPQGPAMEVVRFELHEGLSQPFRLELELSSTQADIDAVSLLDGPAIFTISRAGEPVREVHGIVTAFELGESGFRRTRYRAVIEPPLMRLALRHNSRIFQRQWRKEIFQLPAGVSLSDRQHRHERGAVGQFQHWGCSLPIQRQ